MTLKSCRSCQTPVSQEARACPHCGAPWPARPDWQGTGYEWRSSRSFLGFPLVHIAFGRDPQGRLRVARGIIAIGQFSVGLITVAQFGVGLIFGFGQFILGLMALAQFAGGGLLAVGQIAVGFAAIGQVVVAYAGLGQAGVAYFLWSPGRKDPEAAWFFLRCYDLVREFLHLR